MKTAEQVLKSYGLVDEDGMLHCNYTHIIGPMEEYADQFRPPKDVGTYFSTNIYVNKLPAWIRSSAAVNRVPPFEPGIIHGKLVQLNMLDELMKYSDSINEQKGLNYFIVTVKI